MPCQSWSWNESDYSVKLQFIYSLLHFQSYTYESCWFLAEWSENVSVQGVFSLLAWQTAVCFCGLIDNVMAATENQSGLAYWCSYNLDTLQGLMSILTRLSLWPHFLLLGDGYGAVCMLMHLGNMAHMRENNGRKTMRKGVSVCLNVASKLTSSPSALM